MTEPSRREMELHNAARLHQQRRLKQNTQFSHKDSADLLPLDGFRKLEAQPPYSLQKRLLETHLSKLRSDPHAPLTAPPSTTEPAQLASTQHTQAPTSETPSPTPTPTPTPETLTPTSETIGVPSLEILTAVHETIALLPKSVVPALEMLSLVVETKAAAAVPLSPVLESQSSREERDEAAATREEEEGGGGGGGGAPAHDSLRVRCKCSGGDATAALCTTRAANLVSHACARRLRLQDWGEEERGEPRSVRPAGATALIGGLLLQLGGRTLRCSAWAIDDDSTDLQLGLETLRDLQVSIDLERDCLVVGGEVKEEIPFLKES